MWAVNRTFFLFATLCDFYISYASSNPLVAEAKVVHEARAGFDAVPARNRKVAKVEDGRVSSVSSVESESQGHQETHVWKSRDHHQTIRSSYEKDDEDHSRHAIHPIVNSDGAPQAAWIVHGGVIVPDAASTVTVHTGTGDDETALLAPPDISDASMLDGLAPHWVAPILYGGIGNVLFQLAALLVYAKEAQAHCVIGFFQHWNRQFHTFDEWGGHPAPGPGITLKHVFPLVQWMSFDSYKVTPATVKNDYAFNIKNPDDYIPMPDKSKLPLQIHGYFFSHRYWHHERQHVLKMLTMNPAIDRYLHRRYDDVLFNATHASVSVHVRLGYSKEPATNLLKERAFPPKVFLENAFDSLGKSKIFLIFSDNVARAKTLLAPVSNSGFPLVYIEENSVMSLRLMSMCMHHILTSSTLSFWGAYLDPAQPTGGRTLLHESFFVSHGREMIPYTEWEVQRLKKCAHCSRV
eukprot:m.843500 g.843500  ORF g.843500 m.843500 type:complete len:464 (+) comp23473_c1_seq1:373-1764(+)